ncbi:MAG: hydrogenase expression/formation protein HypE, partial [Marinilabiliales bacterium]
VVNRSKCDKVFINTAGVGYLDDKQEEISYGTNIKSGDKIIINGTIGDHGIAIIGTRNELSFTSDIQSDCAPLNHLIQKAILISDNIKFMRDATRGGLATVMVELAENSNLGIKLYEDSIPVKESVRGMCEVFGFDPLHVANEGKVVMVVSAEDANKVLNAIRKDEYGKDAAIIGEVTTDNTGKVRLNTEIGGSRIVDMLAGEQLPRIC